MAARVGLVGLGRIGRNIFRILYKREDIRVAAISEIADHKGLEYLLRFDAVLGRFPDEVAIREGNLYVVGRQVPMISEKERPPTIDLQPLPGAKRAVSRGGSIDARPLLQAACEKEREIPLCNQVLRAQPR